MFVTTATQNYCSIVMMLLCLINEKSVVVVLYTSDNLILYTLSRLILNYLFVGNLYKKVC